jgi:DNA-damage-inducible protein J
MRKHYICKKKEEPMAQTAMTIRMDNDLKVQFDALCDQFGMSTNTAINIFARAVVRSRSIPFVIEAPAKEDVLRKGQAAFDELRRIAAQNGLSGMSLDEINEEIRLAREGR